jgi:hypothetical protein
MNHNTAQVAPLPMRLLLDTLSWSGDKDRFLGHLERAFLQLWITSDAVSQGLTKWGNYNEEVGKRSIDGFIRLGITSARALVRCPEELTSYRLLYDMQLSLAGMPIKALAPQFSSNPASNPSTRNFEQAVVDVIRNIENILALYSFYYDCGRNITEHGELRSH